MILGVVWLGRIVRAVWIVEVQPKEKRTLRIFLQPDQRMGDTFSRLAIDQAEVPVLKLLRRECVIVKIESARQSPTAVKHKRTDHGARPVAILFEGLSHRA